MTTPEKRGFFLDEIAQLVGAVPHGKIPDRLEIDHYSIDSREVNTESTLFIAVKGDRFDGADFVASALENGAQAVLTHRVDSSATGLQLIVEDTRKALQELAKAWRLKFDIPIVAVTGSNGKTTTKDVLAHVLRSRMNTASSIGNLNSQLGLPLCILNTLRETHQIGVFETGMSEPGEIRKLCEILRPNIGIVTNVGVAHLEFHSSLESIFEAKSELIDSLPESGFLILNGSCSYHGRMRDRFGGRSTTVTAAKSTRATADLVLRIENTDLAGTHGILEITGSNECAPFSFPIPGCHMAYPALQAIAAAIHIGFNIEEALQPLRSVVPTSHRMEVRKGPWTILDDSYNANPPSTEAVLEFFKRVNWPGRKLVVLGDMLELGPDGIKAHLAIVQRALDGRYLDMVMLVGALFGEALSHVDHDLRVVQATTRAPIAEHLASTVRAGDLILLKGSRGIGLDRLLEDTLSFPPS